MLIKNESEMLRVGAIFAKICSCPLVVYLLGQLGAGKTTFSRGFLQGLGYEGRVKSPTYNLVEPYLLNHIQVFHFDFYRIQDPEELELIGIRDYFTDQSICLIEWPELGGDRTPPPDIICDITISKSERWLEFKSQTNKGDKILKAFFVILAKAGIYPVFGS